MWLIDRLETPGTDYMGLDTDAAKRGVDRVNPGPRTGDCKAYRCLSQVECFRRVNEHQQMKKLDIGR